VRLCRDRSFFRVAIQEEWGRPTGLLQSLWGTAVRILLESADSSILIRCPNSMSLLFCMIEVRRGCSVRTQQPIKVCRDKVCTNKTCQAYHSTYDSSLSRPLSTLLGIRVNFGFLGGIRRRAGKVNGK